MVHVDGCFLDESWVETIFGTAAKQLGAVMKVGRNHEIVYPINWQPAWAGSQKPLVPDIIIESEKISIIIDAKYKRHLEELERTRWSGGEAELREQHRNDLLQILAYANLARRQNVILCLAYPCSASTWYSLQERGVNIRKAEIAVGSKRIQLWMAAIPMAVSAGEIAAEVVEHLRAAGQN